MAGGTITTADAAIAEYLNGLVPTLDSQQTDFQNLIPTIPSQGDDSFRWNVHYGGNSSTTSFSEGDAISAAGNETYAQAYVAYSTGYYRTIYSVTGHMADSTKGGYFDAITQEGEGALMAHKHGQETNLITMAEAAIDSAGSYGGLLRATYRLDSTEGAAGGDLAMSDLDTIFETLTADPIAIDPTGFVVISPVDTRGEYNDVMTGTGAGDTLWLENKEGVTVDGGRFKFNAAYNGAPWITVRGMTTGGLLYLNPADCRIVEHRSITVTPLARLDDSARFAITSCKIFVHLNPRKAGKITT